MRTLVISDLHLGATSRSDLLRRPELREPLLEAVADADRLVILGDAIELREVPVRHAAHAAKDVFADLAAALGRSKELVLVAGNHDHGIVAPWLDARLFDPASEPLRLEERFSPDDAGPLAQRIADAASETNVSLAYPGLTLRDDVYAIHGHYADLHTTVPTFERLAAGAMTRFATRIPDHEATPDHYEAALAPLYAWMLAHAQRDDHAAMSAGAGASAKVWQRLTNGPATPLDRVKGLALAGGFTAAVAAINRIGLGPVRADLSGAALRQGYLRGMGEAVRRLGIDAAHVIWGHSHRAGPFPADDLSEWTAPTGARLHNSGSWVYQPHFVGGAPNASPYWPGTVIELDDAGREPPRLRRLLGTRGHAQLAPPPA